MSLADEAAATQLRQGPRCTIARLAKTDPALHAELVEAMATDLPHTAIARALRNRGVHMGAATIGRHRNGTCQCQR